MALAARMPLALCLWHMLLAMGTLVTLKAPRVCWAMQTLHYRALYVIFVISCELRTASIYCLEVLSSE